MDLNHSTESGLGFPKPSKPSADHRKQLVRRQSSGVFPDIVDCSSLAPVDALSQHGFSIRDMLGKGSFGEVWSLIPTKGAASQQDCSEPDVVAKMIYKKRSRGSLSDMRSRNAILREAYVASHGHEHLVSCQSLLETSTSFVLCMERASEGDLFTALQEDRFAGDTFGTRTANVLKDVASGLRFLHEQLNTMHLDVKPENVLLTPNCAKLCDFGSALPAFSHGIRLAGSAPYTSPELLAWYHGQRNVKQKLPFEVLPTYDVWSLAVLSMTMLLRGHAWCSARAEDADFQRFYTVVLQGGDLSHVPTSQHSPWCYIPLPLLNLYQQTLAFNPESRPTMEVFEGLLHRVWAAGAQCYETGLDLVVEADGSLSTASNASQASETMEAVAASSDDVTDHPEHIKQPVLSQSDDMDTIISTPASSVLEETHTGSMVSLV
eukprot:m.69018 g.69018  ORF g.69018 m.69018 type:complete len:434 (-) comp14104_c0_seq1:100-1401(-)